MSFTTTNASGAYSFGGGLLGGTYIVRVANSSVTSSRGGSGLLSVQTFRTNASSGTAVAVSDHVGGEVPGKVDAGNGSTTLVALTTATTTAQSITTVVIGILFNVDGVDFGYSFNAIVNKNFSAQGSLHQLLTNANALSNAGLTQSGLTAGIDNAVFMLADGTARPGLTASYASMFVSGIASVALTSALPAVTDPVILDATLQPGFSGVPKIELNGTSAGAGVTGLTISAGSSTVRGLIINHFTVDGIHLITSGNNTITGNYIGTNASATAAAANTTAGIKVSSSNNTIGGPTAAARNLLSGNGSYGVETTGSSNIVQGNYIGVNLAGTGAIANGIYGVYIHGSATSNTVGGTAAGTGNVISGNASHALVIDGSGTSGTLVQGNYLGTNSAGTAALPNAGNGVYIINSASDNTIGGTAAGASNLISGNGGKGVSIGTGTGNAILSNSIYANTGIGIDLTDNGVSLNDGAKSAALANSGMDTPVFTSSQLSGTTLTVAGYVGSAAGQTTFAAATVQIFRSDNDSSGYGEGQTFLGTLTTDANGNFSGVMTVSGLAPGDKITGTATDASNNTSEFSANAFASPPSLALVQGVAPSGTQPPATDLVYGVVFTNVGGIPATANIVTSPIPPYTDFKVGSVTTNLGTTGLTVVVEYSNTSGSTWTYTPVSAAGGAPAGYDRLVTNLRWTFTGNLSETPPNNTGSVGFTIRIR